MLKIKHLQIFFGVSLRTAQRKMAFYRDVFNKKDITITEFLRYENINSKDFYDSMQLCLQF